MGVIAQPLSFALRGANMFQQPQSHVTTSHPLVFAEDGVVGFTGIFTGLTFCTITYRLQPLDDLRLGWEHGGNPWC